MALPSATISHVVTQPNPRLPPLPVLGTAGGVPLLLIAGAAAAAVIPSRRRGKDGT
ncbi:hypothetical protein ACFFGH_20515 [Lysobacter korlensis]|uniref:Uncharacterized protein n=1 Tax=Lysobacter korlensis TaxID=553636 RepID=A0ABV6RTA6_9GAMM